MKSTVALVGIITALLSTVAPASLAAQGQSALEVVERLNDEAMEAYLNMDIERAGSLLEEALRVAREGGVGGAPLAQTNLNLGVIYVGGLGDSNTGASYFLAAVCTVPSTQLDPLNSTPEMQQAFASAREQAQRGGCPSGLGAAPSNTSPLAPSVAIAPGSVSMSAMDNETPWGESEGGGDDGDFRRFYFQLSFTLGVAYIQPGMKPDRKPPDGAVYGTYDINDTREPPAIVSPIPDPVASFQQNLNLPEDAPATDLIPFQLRPNTPWLPDGDTVDDLGALQGACPGDDIETGASERLIDQALLTDIRNGAFTFDPSLPADPATQEAAYVRSRILPSSYCVNVASAGFAQTMALRMALGYFVTESIGLGLVGRLQLGAGQGSFANFLFGPRIEFMLTGVDATGPSVSLFLGGTMGQIQIKSPTGPVTYADPNSPDPNNPLLIQADAPWIVSGLFGAHLGVSTRFRFHPNFGLVFAPEVDVQFPDLLVNLDLPLGVEAAF